MKQSRVVRAYDAPQNSMKDNFSGYGCSQCEWTHGGVLFEALKFYSRHITAEHPRDLAAHMTYRYQVVEVSEVEPRYISRR